MWPISRSKPAPDARPRARIPRTARRAVLQVGLPKQVAVEALSASHTLRTRRAVLRRHVLTRAVACHVGRFVAVELVGDAQRVADIKAICAVAEPQRRVRQQGRVAVRRAAVSAAAPSPVMNARHMLPHQT